MRRTAYVLLRTTYCVLRVHACTCFVLSLSTFACVQCLDSQMLRSVSVNGECRNTSMDFAGSCLSLSVSSACVSVQCFDFHNRLAMDMCLDQLIGLCFHRGLEDNGIQQSRRIA